MRILKRSIISVSVSGWVLLLWLGIDNLFEYRQLQDAGQLHLESFPYLQFSRKLIGLAMAWLFIAALTIAFANSHYKRQEPEAGK